MPDRIGLDRTGDELRELRAKVASLEVENEVLNLKVEALQAQIDELQNPTSLSADEEKILVALAKSHNGLSESTLSMQLQMNAKIVEMHCAKLHNESYIEYAPSGPGSIAYRIGPKGTAHLIKRKIPF